jgi:hypothetical protein
MIIAISVILFLFVLIFCLLHNRKLSAREQFNKIVESLVITKVFPSGLKVKSAKPISDSFATAFSYAFERRLPELAAAYGWENAINPAEYTVYVFPVVREYDENNQYSPAFKVPIDSSDPYANSDYVKTDEDGNLYILAAEQVVDADNKIFIVAHYEANWQQSVDAIYFGIEHILAYHNDPELYLQTRDHSQGGGHPILPIPPAVENL